MVARVGPPTAANSFEKAEGMLTAASGDAVVFTESGALPNPGNVWKLTDLSQETVHGQIIVAGSFARMARPDNIRFTDAGDLFIMEDHGSADFAQPGTGGANQVWLLPARRDRRGEPRALRDAPEPVRADGYVVLERQQDHVPLGAGRPAVPEQGDRHPANGRKLQPAVRPLESGSKRTMRGPATAGPRRLRPARAPAPRPKRAAARAPSARGG